MRKPVPALIRRRVFIRDQFECQWKDLVTGKKCGAKRFLDLDHIQPVAEHGTNELTNLRVICANHNRNRMWLEPFQNLGFLPVPPRA